MATEGFDLPVHGFNWLSSTIIICFIVLLMNCSCALERVPAHRIFAFSSRGWRDVISLLYTLESDKWSQGISEEIFIEPDGGHQCFPGLEIFVGIIIVAVYCHYLLGKLIFIKPCNFRDFSGHFCSGRRR